jgi:HlyD family secretion protein
MSARGGRAQVVFVKNGQELEPRVVRLGLSDFDYAEVLDGVKDGEEVVLLGIVEAQNMRQETQSRMRQRMGSGVPGVPGGTGRGGGSGGGGGRRGGG